MFTFPWFNLIQGIITRVPNRRRPRRSYRPLLEGCECRLALSFLPPVNYSVGFWPSLAVVGDITNDGNLDIMVPNNYWYTVSVFIGSGTGAFTYAGERDVGPGPATCVLGDFNNDANLDLAVTNYYPSKNSVSVVLGDGAGGFSNPVTYPGFTMPNTIVKGDFNGDGNLDLAATNEGSVSVGILMGIGGGAFAPVQNVTVGLGPGGIDVGDLNADGLLDLVVGNMQANTMGVLLGNGDGTFQPVLLQAVSAMPTDVALGNFDGDGVLDLLVNHNGANNVWFLRGNGDGTFQAPLVLPTAAAPWDIGVNDFNLDGYLDMVIAYDSTTSPDASVILGNGDGTFQPRHDFVAGGHPVVVEIGDLNNDFYPDLVITNPTDENISVLLNDANWGAGPHGSPGSNPGNWLDLGMIERTQTARVEEPLPLLPSSVDLPTRFDPSHAAPASDCPWIGKRSRENSTEFTRKDSTWDVFAVDW